MRRIKKRAEIIEGAEVRIDVEIIGDVVAVITQRRGIEWQEPDGRNAELLEIIELFDQAAEVAHPIAVAVTKRLNVQLIDDRVIVQSSISSRLTYLLRYVSILCHKIL